ncbi:hypothetical protein F5B21DRAFT_101194 [Xylaria acuta]|nr:hypothetical protein F5B21DRAFT_101194 [Xylaria acuta]
MSALFNFQSLLLVILLLICTSAYVHNLFPTILDRNKQGLMGIFWKAARIGERLSPYISLCCLVMAVRCPLCIYPTKSPQPQTDGLTPRSPWSSAPRYFIPPTIGFNSGERRRGACKGVLANLS